MFTLLRKSHLTKGEEKDFVFGSFLHCGFFSFACFYSAVEFEPGLRGFIAKCRIFCLSWQVCLLSAGAPYVLFVLGTTALCTTKKRSKDVPPAHS